MLQQLMLAKAPLSMILDEVSLQKGSHRQFHHQTKPGTITIAGGPSVNVPPGTLNSALKQAGLKWERQRGCRNFAQSVE